MAESRLGSAIAARDFETGSSVSGMSREEDEQLRAQEEEAKRAALAEEEANPSSPADPSQQESTETWGSR